MSAGPPTRRDPFWALLAIITLLGAVVRVIVAATEPPHFDESYTAIHSVLNGGHFIVTTYAEPNNHILHSLLAWISTDLFGRAPFALRLPALIAGIALVPATGLLARATVRHARRAETAGPVHYGRGGVAGLVAAAITAGAPPLVIYSANARGYTLVLLLMTGQLLLSLRLAERKPTEQAHSGEAIESTEEAQSTDAVQTTEETQPTEVTGDEPSSPEDRLWAAWAICGALAIWTVPTAVIGVGVAAVWVIALRGGPSKRDLRPYVAIAATFAVSLLLYAPVLGQRGFTVDRFDAAPARELATTLVHAWTAGLAAPLIAVAFVLAVIGVARRPQLGPGATLAIGLLAVPVAALLLGRLFPYSRTYLFLLPILAVLAGVGAARLLPGLERLGRAAVAIAAIAVGAAAIAAGATAQTREAWGEDPPGPSRGDLIAALREAFPGQKFADPEEALVQPGTNEGPGEASAGTGPIVPPPFDLPQVEYALRQGINDGPGFTAATGFRPLFPHDAWLLVTSQVPLEGPFTMVTRAGVAPETALRALQLNPAAYVTRPHTHGDAQVIATRPR